MSDPATVATIVSAIKECNSHLSRINRARKLLGSEFPLSEKSFLGFGEDVVEHLDQLIYRFTKLQDSMGTRLLPSLYVYVENDNSPKPFLSILLRLEQLDVLTSSEDWQFFRNLRNNLAHDYPESTKQTAETLNALYQELDRLEKMYDKIRIYWQSLKTEVSKK